MPRHPRVHAEGLLYHVMARGNDGQKIFLGESDYQAFIEALRTVRQRYPFSLDAYVLMPNHFHLLLEVHRFPTAREGAKGSSPLLAFKSNLLSCASQRCLLMMRYLDYLLFADARQHLLSVQKHSIASGLLSVLRIMQERFCCLRYFFSPSPAAPFRRYADHRSFAGSSRIPPTF